MALEVHHQAEAAALARFASIPASIRHVHLIGVAGTAMAAVAGMLVERGFRVTGSDNQLYEPTASLLKHKRIDLRSGFSPANLSPAPDLVVVGNVITRANPEAQALLQSRIPYLSMPEAIRHFFLRGKTTLMVTGTHGKTTSTSIMARVLAHAGRDPSMLVGGVAKDFDSNYRLGSGDDFVIEGDEYDTAFFDKGPKFLHYHARGAIVTAVEFDHADIYRDLEHVKTSFRALAQQMPSSGVLVVCADSPPAVEVSAGTPARRVTYGLKAGEFSATNISIDADGAHFDVEHEGATASRNLMLSMGGKMNVANALGVFVLLRNFGLGIDEIAAGLRSFSGVVRRQELIGEAAGITVIDDFAHHPTAIRATLDAVAERFAGRRIIAAFEPRSNTSRRNVFQDDFGAAFTRAAAVFLGPVYFKENDPIPETQRLDTKRLTAAIEASGTRAFACSSNDEVLAGMLSEARSGDLALFMSNGPFDNLKNRFLSELRSRA